ncbi:hypothetical protein DZF92_13830 [Clavibacter michiganensis subsp. insidiosus]|nr:hypothetical protein DZF92_13830 [Clavibacter michiganensis subsp. insidiosus]
MAGVLRVVGHVARLRRPRLRGRGYQGAVPPPDPPGRRPPAPRRAIRRAIRPAIRRAIRRAPARGRRPRAWRERGSRSVRVSP